MESVQRTTASLKIFRIRFAGRKVRFGDDVWAELFRGHHGNWHADSTRGLIIEEIRITQFLVGVEDVWGPSDVYRTYPEGKASC